MLWKYSMKIQILKENQDFTKIDEEPNLYCAAEGGSIYSAYLIDVLDPHF
jgi:hypothetical protein